MSLQRHVTVENLVAIFHVSPWARKLGGEHLKKLYYLASFSDDGNGKQVVNDKLDILDVIHCFLWLGDHELTVQQAIPAHLAIDFLHHFVTTNTQS